MSDLHHFLRVRVERIEPLAQDVKALRLVPVRAGTLPAFSAGAHVDVRLPNGLSRSYSITSADDCFAHYDIAVARDASSRGGSAFVHEQVAAGDELFMSAPKNHFPLHEGMAPAVLIAGGIGITPIRAMVRRLQREGRPWTLHYACRSRGRAAFLEELQAAAAASEARMQVWLDDEEGNQLLDVRALVAQAAPNAHLYCCGPAPMLETFAAACSARPAEHVHLEHFKPVTTAASSKALATFKVELARTGRVVHVSEGSTILDALMMNGIDVPYSCCEGLCGTCETRVIAGTPDHRDNLLTERARKFNDAIILCMSGSKSPLLVLDL